MMKIPNYLDLRTNAPARLASLKFGGADWRSARAWGLHNWRDAYGAGLHQGSNAGRALWYTHQGEQFRNEKYADEIVRLSHTGWFADPDQTEKYRGIVGALSHGRFIAGYECFDSGQRTYFDGVYPDQEEAARAADSLAEHYASKEFEYQERYAHAQKIADKIEARKLRVGECFALRNHPRFRDDVREEIPQLIECIRKCADRLAREFNDVYDES